MDDSKKSKAKIHETPYALREAESKGVFTTTEGWDFSSLAMDRPLQPAHMSISSSYAAALSDHTKEFDNSESEEVLPSFTKKQIPLEAVVALSFSTKKPFQQNQMNSTLKIPVPVIPRKYLASGSRKNSSNTPYSTSSSAHHTSTQDIGTPKFFSPRSIKKYLDDLEIDNT